MADRIGFTDRRWVRRALALSIGGLLLSGIASVYLVGAGANPLSVDRALERFRGDGTQDAAAGTTTASPTGSALPGSSPSVLPTKTTASGPSPAAAAGPTEPDEGVYVYDTTGYEETDALSGQRHDYPEQTTMTISRYSCGFVWRWQPLDERWEESEGCRTSEGVVLKRFTMYHEFFRRGVREDLLCDDDAIVSPATPRPGDRWTFGCTSSDTSIAMTVSVVGFETRTVGGKAVRAVRLRYEAVMSGDNEGTLRQDRWLDARTSLALRIVTATDARVESPFGMVGYTERYTIDLVSTTPRR